MDIEQFWKYVLRVKPAEKAKRRGSGKDAAARASSARIAKIRPATTLATSVDHPSFKVKLR